MHYQNMSPLSRLLLSRLSKKSIYIAPSTTRRPQVICAACALFRLQRASVMAAKAPVVLAVKQSAEFTAHFDNMQGCMDGKSLPTANSGFIISSPNLMTGLGPGRVQFITITTNLVTLAPMQKYFLCGRV